MATRRRRLEGNQREFELTLESQHAELYHGNGSSYTNVRTAFGVVQLNGQHIVVTRTAASKTIQFYVNGAARGSGTYVMAPAAGTRPVSIGRADAALQYVNGRLDEVALYPAVLTAAQIAAHYALRTSTGPGATVLLQLSAADPDGDPVTFSATGLPTGVSLDASTGLISGTLTAASVGTHTVTVTAAAGGLSQSQTFTWVVTATP